MLPPVPGRGAQFLMVVFCALLPPRERRIFFKIHRIPYKIIGLLLKIDQQSPKARILRCSRPQERRRILIMLVFVQAMGRGSPPTFPRVRILRCSRPWARDGGIWVQSWTWWTTHHNRGNTGRLQGPQKMQTLLGWQHRDLASTLVIVGNNNSYCCCQQH